MSEDKTRANKNRVFFAFWMPLFGIQFALLLFARFPEPVAWPVVFFAVKSMFLSILGGVIGTSLVGMRTRTKSVPLKVVLILGFIVYVILASTFFAFWLLPPIKPEMDAFEERMFETIILFAFVVAVSVGDLTRFWAEQPLEEPKPGKLTVFVTSMLKHVTSRDEFFLAVAGSIFLGIVVAPYFGVTFSVPYLAPILIIMGCWSLLVGVWPWLVARMPFLEPWLNVLQWILILAFLYFGFKQMMISE